MSRLTAMFCNHKYKLHNKVTRQWEDKRLVDGTEMDYHPVIKTIQIIETTEILICEKCGDIKKIKY